MHQRINNLCSLELTLCLNPAGGRVATQECKHNKHTAESQIWFQSQAAYKVVMYQNIPWLQTYQKFTLSVLNKVAGNQN